MASFCRSRLSFHNRSEVNCSFLLSCFKMGIEFRLCKMEGSESLQKYNFS